MKWYGPERTRFDGKVIRENFEHVFLLRRHSGSFLLQAVNFK